MAFEATNSPCWGENFHTTQWSVVLRAKRGSAEDADKALQELCSLYWRPVYTFIRRSGHTEEDARDLTQELFMHLLSGNFLRYIQPEQGRFRTYLLHCAKNFLVNEWRRQGAVKRGGGIQIVPLEEISLRDQEEIFATRAPENSFDRQWANSLLQQAFARLRAEVEASGHSEKLLALQGYLTGSEESKYKEAATSLGMTKGAVKVAVYRLRCAFRQILREEVAKTVAEDADVEDEIKSLIQALG